MMTGSTGHRRSVGMTSPLIHDRGRGPELVGTRITVYNLLVDFLDPTVTEADVCTWYHLTPQQVAAGRAYILAHFEEVMAVHRRIEAARERSPSPEVIEMTRRARAGLELYREWMTLRKQQASSANGAAAFPTFREWRANRERQPVEPSGESA
jgi:uncharacterized protein (DUF433 family)